MKYFKRHTVFGLLSVLHFLDCVSCGDHIYEQIADYVQDSNYVDPHSLYHSRHSKSVKKSSHYSDANDHKSDIVLRDSGYYQKNCKDGLYEAFARRLINIIISKSNIKIDNGFVTGHLNLEATVEELQLLKEFGNGQDSVRQVDSIVNDIIRSIEISLFDEALTYADRFSIYIYQHRIIFGAMLLSLFVIIIALKVKWTRWRIIFLIFDIMVIISFMLTWWELLQESEMKLAAQREIYSSMPEECRKNQISFFKSVLFFFGYGKGDCLKYFEAVMSDPVLKVTPMHAFSHMTTKFFLHPISLTGQYFSEFIENITSEIPFPFNIVAKVILVLFIPCFVGMLLLVSIGGSMGVRLGPFFHIYLHARQPPSDTLTSHNRQAIEVILPDAGHVAITSAEVKETLPAKKETPKKITNLPQRKQLDIQESKREEIESNSDDFPEEEEYEKISSKAIEKEFSPSERKKNKTGHNLSTEEEEILNQLRRRNGKALEIGSGDS